MATGLRRFWGRQKAHSRASSVAHSALEFQPTPTYEVHISGPAPQLGALPFKPSQHKQTATPSAQSRTQNARPTAVRDWKGEDHFNEGTLPSPGIKPILLGISRPSTAGSFAQAVNHAADAVAQDKPHGVKPRSKSSRMIPIATPIDKVQKPGKARYVDIFQVASRGKDSELNYNEEVARRNLDLQALALGGPVGGYTTSSKYGEDVAVRNASIELLRDSLDRSHEHHPTNDRTGIRFQGQGILRRHKPPQSQPAASESLSQIKAENNADRSRNRPVQRSHVPKWRHEQASKLGAYVQAGEGQQNSATSNSLKSPLLEEGKAQVFSASGRSKQAYGGKSPQYEVSQITEEFVRQNPTTKISSKANVGRPLVASGARGTSSTSTATQNSLSSLPGYQITANEDAWNHHHSYSGRTKNTTGRDSGLGAHNKDSQEIASTHSGTSKASSLRKAVKLSNRTIMDLTGDDSEVFSDTDAISSYIESPVVQQAQFKSLHTGQPLLVTPVDQSAERSQSQSHPEHVQPAQSEFVDLTQVEAPQRARVVENEMRKQHMDNDISDDGEITPTAAQPEIAFSQINTVASFSPRASVAEPTALGRSMGNFGEPTRPPATTKTQSIAKSHIGMPISSQNNSAPLSIFVTHTNEDNTRSVVESPTIPMHPTTRGKALKSKFARNGTLPPVVEDVPQISPISNQVTGTPGAASNDRVFASPESLQSGDFVHPSHAFGVVTRDFASAPSSHENFDDISWGPLDGPGNHLRHDDFPRTLNYDDNDSDAYSPPRYVDNHAGRFDDTAFNEEEFARKQSQAKAALLRLQQSLKEDFDHLPIMNGHSVPSKPFKHGQKIPTSKFTRGEKFATIEPVPRTSTASVSKSARSGTSATTKPANVAELQAESKPAPSFYSMVTSTPTTPLHSPKPSRQINGDHSHVRQNSTAVPEASPQRPLPAYFDLSGNGAAPVSPSEVSLSSFPLPNPTPQHSRQTSLTQVPALTRRTSLKSISSNASAFSIPYHMVPGRSSSMRDHVDTFSLDE